MAFLPKNPPSSFDASALVKALNEARAKVGLAPHVSGLPLWKRYVGSEGPEYDEAAEGGLRAVQKANATEQNQLKTDLDKLDDREASHYGTLNQRVSALEAAPSSPFPFRDSSSAPSSRAGSSPSLRQRLAQRLRAITGPPSN